ncbi:uncharacterized protein BDV17DRAFT_230267 [Aspergillus undulatus]|uniref:uncharacterized protein n=1 Tax=Aspergillus undulatus TaxID=1810928 RepID=UPI003CCD0468
MELGFWITRHACLCLFLWLAIYTRVSVSVSAFGCIRICSCFGLVWFGWDWISSWARMRHEMIAWMGMDGFFVYGVLFRTGVQLPSQPSPINIMCFSLSKQSLLLICHRAALTGSKPRSEQKWLHP